MGMQDLEKELIGKLVKVYQKYGVLSRRQYERLPQEEQPVGISEFERVLGWGRAKELATARLGLSQIEAPPLPPSKPDIQKEFGREKGTVTTNSPRIKTLDEALAAAEVDLDTWEVDRFVVNKWEVGAKQLDGSIKVEPLFQVKAWLKRKITPSLGLALERLTERLLEAPPLPEPTYRQNSLDPHLLEICLFDHHFGKYAWAEETGTDYDIRIAESLYVNAAVDLLTKAGGMAIDKVLLPIGNDFFHINNVEGTTEKGTRQDLDTRLPLVFETGAMAVIKAIEKFRQVAPVHLLWVPGNHDPLTSYFLCKYLEAYYRKNPEVSVDTGPKFRKCFQYGVNLIGYTHGSEEAKRDLPVNMAAEWPQEWAATQFREWHIGHVHKKAQTSFMAADTWGGVQVRVIPSLCGTDAWHYKKGFVKNHRAAEAYLWSRERGYTGHFSSNFNELCGHA